ncbi:DUF3857 domain-containing protein [Pedobacter gandavensis]|uniref:DUF3857 domain-containing protein n=1 Tax=Pedobacter gandavensis TaxID=2679963 RepID=A0ABR6ETD0_9SPHI|nr:DUF3857 domain-containing protein [Pedobacter gandavensis]MBB2148519.1 DUF3857 domain-containing protein [Pedobacter gandavensis]
MKRLLLLSLLLLVQLTTQAQDFPFAGITHEELDLKNTVIDSNANAIVLKEFGTARIQLNADDSRLVVTFNYHVRIKIFNKQGYEQGNITIPQRIYGDKEDQITNIKAVTVNFIDGEFKQTALDPKKIFHEKSSKYTAQTKFTIPNLQDGSIIEYSYQISSPYIFNFRPWNFQSDIPKLHSEYVAYIPGLYNYNVVLRGALKLSDTKAELNKECLRLNGTNVDCSKMTYIMKNIPAFIEENYMTAPVNFKSAINFELSDYVMITGGKVNLTKSWKDIDYELKSDRSFGSQMKKKDAFKDLMPEILKNTTDDLSKAKAVYAYIAKNIKSNGYIGIYSENDVKKALASHSGNTGDINLGLISALTAANLDAEALILSTRNNGELNRLFPVITNFNYVVVKVNIGEQSFLLDASVPLLPFGMLPLHCINGQGRVISLKKPSYWYDVSAGQKDYSRYNFNATLTKDGKIKGELITYSSGYTALKKRKAIEEANSIAEYVEKLDEKMPKISITQHEILNLDSLQLPLTEKYELLINSFDAAQMSKVFFSPFFIEHISKNPFNLNDRTYPVDLGGSSECRINIQLTIPEDYVLVDQPKDMSIGLADNGGRYLTKTQVADHVITFTQLLQLSKPIYDPSEYLSLKEFYSQIIQNQKTDIILKKTP